MTKVIVRGIFMHAGMNSRQPRTFFRWPFEHKIVVLPVEPAMASPVSMTCRDLSAGGIRCICNMPIAEGTAVIVALPELCGCTRGVRARIMRCVRDKHNSFDWSLRFDEPIDPSRHIARDTLSNLFTHESVAPHNIAGRIALLSESTHDHALFNIALRGASCVFTTHTTIDSLLFDAKRLDTVIIASDLHSTTTSDAIISLIAAECNANFVLLAADRSPSTRKLATLLPFRAALAKPCQPQIVLAALAQASSIIAVQELTTMKHVAS